MFLFFFLQLYGLNKFSRDKLPCFSRIQTQTFPNWTRQRRSLSESINQIASQGGSNCTVTAEHWGLQNYKSLSFSTKSPAAAADIFFFPFSTTLSVIFPPFSRRAS